MITYYNNNIAVVFAPRRRLLGGRWTFFAGGGSGVAAVSVRLGVGGAGGGERRKSTTGPHTLSPSPPPLRSPRRICGQCRSSGTTGHAHRIGPPWSGRPVISRWGVEGEIDIRTATPHPPATTAGGLGSALPRPPPPQTVSTCALAAASF